MPADPELPPSSPAVETMLRETARRRRAAFDAAGPDARTLPGPVRTRLHAELAKQFLAPADRAAAAGWFARWWPVLTGAAGVSVALALFVFAVGQRPPASPVASHDARPARTPSPALEAAKPVAATAPALVAAAPTPDQSRTAGNAPVAQADSAAPAGALATSEPVRTQTFTQSPLPLALAGGRGSADQLRAAPAASAPAPARAKARRDAAPAAASPTPSEPPPLLGNFRFEQRGESVRVVDADGSVYVGQVQPPATSSPAPALARQAGEAAGAKDSRSRAAENSPANAENFRFQATGDNRTLRKPVMFEGEYTVPAATPDLAPAAAVNSAAPGKPSAAAPAAPEAQIRGRVRVLDGKQEQRAAEVDARSVP